MPLWPFDPRARLLHLLDNLAFYNDKGIAYARHSPTQVDAERAKGLAKARALVAAVDPNALPPELLRAIEDGSAASDGSGRYVDAMRTQLRRRKA